MKKILKLLMVGVLLFGLSIKHQPVKAADTPRGRIYITEILTDDSGKSGEHGMYTWNQHTHTLTLENVNIKADGGHGIFYNDQGSGLDLNIVLKGENTIDVSGSQDSTYGILKSGSGKLTIKGDGRLTIKVSDEQKPKEGSFVGIHAVHLIIGGHTKLDVETSDNLNQNFHSTNHGSFGLDGRNISIIDNAQVNIKAGKSRFNTSAGIRSSAGNVVISSKQPVNIESYNHGILFYSNDELNPSDFVLGNQSRLNIKIDGEDQYQKTGIKSPGNVDAVDHPSLVNVSINDNAHLSIDLGKTNATEDSSLLLSSGIIANQVSINKGALVDIKIADNYLIQSGISSKQTQIDRATLNIELGKTQTKVTSSAVPKAKNIGIEALEKLIIKDDSVVKIVTNGVVSSTQKSDNSNLIRTNELQIDNMSYLNLQALQTWTDENNANLGHLIRAAKVSMGTSKLEAMRAKVAANKGNSLIGNVSEVNLPVGTSFMGKANAEEAYVDGKAHLDGTTYNVVSNVDTDFEFVLINSIINDEDFVTSLVNIPKGVVNSSIGNYNLNMYVSGQEVPYTFTLESGPDWLKIQGNNLYGIRPNTKADEQTAKIKVTSTNGKESTLEVNVGAILAEQTTYKVAITNGQGPSEAVEGELVDIVADSVKGKVFVKWLGEGVSFINESDISTSFVMPNHDVAISVVYDDATTFKVTLENAKFEDGEREDRYEGESVFVRANILPGKQFKRWMVEPAVITVSNTIVYDGNIGSFYMPAQAVKITAVYEDIVYKLTAGANQSFTLGSDKELTFVIDADYEGFAGVELNDQLLEPKHYGSQSGSTVVTLKNAFLNTLKEGKHTIAFVFKDGVKTETEFTILAATQEPVKPDDSKPDDSKPNETKPEGGQSEKDKLPGMGDNHNLSILAMLLMALGWAVIEKSKMIKE